MHNLKNKPMKQLANKVSTNGHNYELFRRSKHVACYKQFDKESGILVGFEIFRVPVRKTEKIKGEVYPERETWASNSQWGMTAFTLPAWSTPEYIVKRFEEMVAEYDNKKKGTQK